MQWYSQKFAIRTGLITLTLCFTASTTVLAQGGRTSRDSTRGKATIHEPDPHVPAPPAPGERPEPLYDYQHAVRSSTGAAGAGLAPKEKYRVALARMQDNIVLDTEFGTVVGGEPVVGKVEKDKDGDKDVIVAHNPERYAVTRQQSMTPEFRALIIDQMTRSGFFEVIEREDILPLLREINFNQGEYVDQDDNVTKGKLVGVDYLVNGEIGLNPEFRQVGLVSSPYSVGAAPGDDMPGEGRFQLVLRMYSTETGQVTASGTGRGPTHELAIEDCVRELIRSLGRSGTQSELRVAMVRDDVVFVDGGLNRGLYVGMRFRVMEEGEEIRNAEGEVIGHDSREVGLVEVTEVEAKMARASIVHSSGDIPVNALLTGE